MPSKRTALGNTARELSLYRGAALLWLKKKLGAMISTLLGLVGEVDRSHSAHVEILIIAVPRPGWSLQWTPHCFQEALSLPPQ